MNQLSYYRADNDLPFFYLFLSDDYKKHHHRIALNRYQTRHIQAFLSRACPILHNLGLSLIDDPEIVLWRKSIKATTLEHG